MGTIWTSGANAFGAEGINVKHRGCNPLGVCEKPARRPWGQNAPKHSLALPVWEKGAFLGITPLRPLSPRAAGHPDLADGQEQALEILGLTSELKAIRGHLVQPPSFTQAHIADKGTEAQRGEMTSCRTLRHVCA